MSIFAVFLQKPERQKGPNPKGATLKKKKKKKKLFGFGKNLMITNRKNILLKKIKVYNPF